MSSAANNTSTNASTNASTSTSGIIRTKIGPTPRVHQQYIDALARRFNVIVCHRRFGKTFFSMMRVLAKAMKNPHRNPQYAYIAPTFGQAKRVVWDILKDMVHPLPNVETHEAELRVTIPRPEYGDQIKIVLLGSENPNAIRGMYLDGAIFDEYQEQNPEVWGKVVRPALLDRLGWADFIGTSKGENHFADLYRFAKKEQADATSEWAGFMFKATETGIVPEKELLSLKKEMTEDEWAQEMLCSFSAALRGAYYAKILEELDANNQIGRVPYDSALPVYTAWDLGIDDSTSIWFIQEYKNTYRAIDYYENAGQGLDHYAKVLKEKPYAYDEHFLPHDIAVREIGATGGASRLETLRSLGIRATVVPKQGLEDGINAVRKVLPKFWFDEVKCHEGLKALRTYQRKWDALRQVWGSKPDHDWSSHASDAFRTFALGLRNIGRSERIKNLPTRQKCTYNVLD